MKTIKLHIQNGYDRQEIVKALANSGYKVWVKEIEVDTIYHTIDYYVCFEVEEQR